MAASLIKLTMVAVLTQTTLAALHVVANVVTNQII